MDASIYMDSCNEMLGSVRSGDDQGKKVSYSNMICTFSEYIVHVLARLYQVQLFYTFPLSVVQSP